MKDLPAIDFTYTIYLRTNHLRTARFIGLKVKNNFSTSQACASPQDLLDGYGNEPVQKVSHPPRGRRVWPKI